MTGALTPFARSVLSFPPSSPAQERSHVCIPSVPVAAGLCPAAVRLRQHPGPEVKGSGRCDASQLGWAIGQPANEPNIRRLSRESGAGLVNPIGPSTITTKDIRQDRLRVFVDKDNVITATRCE